MIQVACQQAFHFEWRESARVGGEAARGGGKGELSFLSPHLAHVSPFARASRVTSLDSLKWRACARPTPKKEREENKLVGSHDRPMSLAKKERKETRTLKYHFWLKQMT